MKQDNPALETCWCGSKIRSGQCREDPGHTRAPEIPGTGYVTDSPASTLDTDHARCDPAAHDRSLPDDGGRPYDQIYDEHGFLSDKQVMAADGLMGCNDCGRPLFYCTNAEWYFHVDPAAGCFLAAPWGH